MEAFQADTLRKDDSSIPSLLHGSWPGLRPMAPWLQAFHAREMSRSLTQNNTTRLVHAQYPVCISNVILYFFMLFHMFYCIVHYMLPMKCYVVWCIVFLLILIWHCILHWLYCVCVLYIMRGCKPHSEAGLRRQDEELAVSIPRKQASTRPVCTNSPGLSLRRARGKA